MNERIRQLLWNWTPLSLVVLIGISAFGAAVFIGTHEWKSNSNDGLGLAALLTVAAAFALQWAVSGWSGPPKRPARHGWAWASRVLLLWSAVGLSGLAGAMWLKDARSKDAASADGAKVTSAMPFHGAASSGQATCAAPLTTTVCKGTRSGVAVHSWCCRPDCGCPQQTIAPAAAQVQVDKGVGPTDLAAFIATILSVVLAVVTLIATKTAADARTEVLAATEKFEAAKSARDSALNAQASLAAVRLVSHIEELPTFYQPTNRPRAAKAKALRDALNALFRVVSRLGGLFDAHVDWTDLQRRSGTALEMFSQLQLRAVPDEVLRNGRREELRQLGTLVLDLVDAARLRGREPTPREEKTWELLQDLAHRLREA